LHVTDLKPETFSLANTSINSATIKLAYKPGLLFIWTVQLTLHLLVVLRISTVLQGLAAVVNRVTCSAPVPGSTLYVHACHPHGALPAPELAGCPVGHGE
jgi:hypothetical protein